MERIYWSRVGEEFYFASEAKALLCVLPSCRDFDVQGVADFLSFGCTLESRTLFKGIATLPPASLWSIEDGEIRREVYFRPSDWEVQELLSTEAFAEQFTATFDNLLPRYCHDSTQLGISLTGGLDSRMIVAALPNIKPPPISYTFAGEEGNPLDGIIAGRIAAASGITHRLVRLASDFFTSFSSHADRTVFVTDGTVGVFGAHEIYLNHRARELAAIRLTGVFGGEIMRGVSFFKPLRLMKSILQPEMYHRVEETERVFSHHKHHPITHAAFFETPQKRFGPPSAARSQLTFRTPFLDNDFVALCYRNPATLKGGGANLAVDFISKRSPALAAIPTDRGYKGGRRTFLSKASAETLFKVDYFVSEGLPRRAIRFEPLFRRAAELLGIAGRYKFLHYGSWLRDELAHYINERCLDGTLSEQHFWRRGTLKTLIYEHQSGRANNVHEISAVLTLEAVERLLLKQASNSACLPIS